MLLATTHVSVLTVVLHLSSEAGPGTCCYPLRAGRSDLQTLPWWVNTPQLPVWAGPSLAAPLEEFGVRQFNPSSFPAVAHTSKGGRSEREECTES